MTENYENSEKLLPIIVSNLKLLDKKKKEVKRLRRIFSIFTTLVVILIIIYIFQIGKLIDPKLILNQTANDIRLRQTTIKYVTNSKNKIIPIVQKEFSRQFIKENNFLNSVTSEFNCFIQVAEHDISKQLTPLYTDLIKKQKKNIYNFFPEFQNNKKVEQAIDNLIKIGSPKLYNSFVSNFEEHKKILLNIFSLVENLKDDSLLQFSSLEKAVFGITLELFGNYFRKEGEKKNEQ